MKQFARILSALLVLLLLAGCSTGGDESPDVENTGKNNSSSIPSTDNSTKPSTDAPTDPSADAPSSAPTEPSTETQPPAIKKTGTITSAQNFSDGYAWVNFVMEDQAYYGVIDTQGKILSKYPADITPTLHRFTGNIAYIEFSTQQKYESDTPLYDALVSPDGIIYTEGDGVFDEILAIGNGQALVYKKEGGVDRVKHLYGTLDFTGNWVLPLSDLGFQPDDYSRYLGDGMFGMRGHIFNSKNGTLIYTMNLDYLDYYGEKLTFYFDKGYALIHSPRECHISTSLSQLHNPENSFRGDILLSADGKVTSVEDFHYSFGSLATFSDYNNNYLKLVDYAEGTDAIFNKYAPNRLSLSNYADGYLCITIRGVDGEDYITLLNRQGIQQFEPVKSTSEGTFSDGKIVFRDSEKTYAIVDQQGNFLAQGLQYGILDCFYNGLALAAKKTGDTVTSIAYINAYGNEVITEVVEG